MTGEVQMVFSLIKSLISKISDVTTSGYSSSGDDIVLNKFSDSSEYKQTKWKKVTKRSKAIEVMKENANVPMDEVVTLIAEAIDVNRSEARNYYRWLSENGYAPGKVDNNRKRLSSNYNKDDKFCKPEANLDTINIKSSESKNLIITNTIIKDFEKAGWKERPIIDGRKSETKFRYAANGMYGLNCIFYVEEDEQAILILATPDFIIPASKRKSVTHFCDSIQIKEGKFEVTDDGELLYRNLIIIDEDNIQTNFINYLIDHMDRNITKVAEDIVNLINGDPIIKKKEGMGELAIIQEKFRSSAAKYYNRLNEEDRDTFNQFKCLVEEGDYWRDSDVNFNLTKESAELIAKKIRLTKKIPVFIPQEIMDTFEFVNWQKAWWYSPVSMAAYQFITPLVLEQNGIWGVTGSDKKFELISNFEHYSNISLYAYSPDEIVDAILGKPIENKEWLALSFGNASYGAKAFQLTFNEYEGLEQIGFHFIVMKAMIDVWMPIVEKSRGAPAFTFENDMFIDFTCIESVILWAKNIREEEINKEIIQDQNLGLATLVNQDENKLPLLERPDFLSILARAKHIAKLSNIEILTPLVFLCAILSIQQTNADFYIDFPMNKKKLITDAAKLENITITITNDEVIEDKFTLSSELKNIIALNKNSPTHIFVLSLLKNLDTNEG